MESQRPGICALVESQRKAGQLLDEPTLVKISETSKAVRTLDRSSKNAIDYNLDFSISEYRHIFNDVVHGSAMEKLMIQFLNEITKSFCADFKK